MKKRRENTKIEKEDTANKTEKKREQEIERAERYTEGERIQNGSEVRGQ